MRLFPQVGKSYVWQQETPRGWVNCIGGPEGDGLITVTSVHEDLGRVGFTDPHTGGTIPFGGDIKLWTQESHRLHVDMGSKVRFRMVEAR